MELPRHTPRARSRAGLIAGLYVLLGLLALGIGLLRGRPNLYVHPDAAAPWFIGGPLLGTGLGLIVVFASRFAVHRFRWARHLHRDFRGLLGGLGPVDVFVLAVASAVGEELLFRGALQPWLGLLPATLIFGLLHIGPGRQFLPWTASALAVGLGLGALYELTGELGAPIFAHFTINYLNLGYIIRVDLPPEPRRPRSTPRAQT